MNFYEKSSDLVDRIIDGIQKVVGRDPISLHKPEFDGNEWRYLKHCLDSSFVSSIGEYVDKFEVLLSEYTESKYAISVVNGTAALQIALILAGVQREDEVLIPSLTFVATANAISYVGAIPHFVDSEEITLGIDAAKLREYLKISTVRQSGNCVNKFTNRVIRALVPMHTFGHPSNIDELLQIAKDFNLVMIEDAAESIGSFYNSKHTGTFGQIGILSFNGNKTITTGGGGAILTGSKELATRAKHLTTTAKLPHAWEFDHDEIGYNFRMPNINAALGCAQIEKIDNKINAKRDLYLRYSEVFKSIEEITLFKESPNCRSNYWLQTIILSENNIFLRDKILERSNSMGIMTRPAWKLISSLKPYRNCPSMELECANFLSGSIINLPSSPSLINGSK